VSLNNSVGNAWTADCLQITGGLDVDLRKAKQGWAGSTIPAFDKF